MREVDGQVRCDGRKVVGRPSMGLASFELELGVLRVDQVQFCRVLGSFCLFVRDG